MLSNCEHKANVDFHVAEFFLLNELNSNKTSFDQKSWPSFLQEIMLLLRIESLLLE